MGKKKFEEVEPEVESTETNKKKQKKSAQKVDTTIISPVSKKQKKASKNSLEVTNVEQNATLNGNSTKSPNTQNQSNGAVKKSKKKSKATSQVDLDGDKDEAIARAAAFSKILKKQKEAQSSIQKDQENTISTDVKGSKKKNKKKPKTEDSQVTNEDKKQNQKTSDDSIVAPEELNEDSDSDSSEEDYFGWKQYIDNDSDAERENILNESKIDDEDNSGADDSDEDEGADDEEENKDTNDKQTTKKKKVKSAETEKKVKKEKPKEKNIKKNDAATIFIGNVPITTKANALKKAFEAYGKIEAIRYRSDTGEILRNKKEYKRCKSLIAYINYEKEEYAQKALEMNGKQINGNIIRVNMANMKKTTFHNKATVFVGNIKFDITDNELHEHFKECGDIDYIRRLPKKGIAWVCFKQSTSVPKAFKLHEQELAGRPLRITKSTEKRRLEHKKKTKKLNKLADSKKGVANNKLLNPNVRPNKNPIYEKMNKSKLQSIPFNDKKAKFGSKHLKDKTNVSGELKKKHGKDSQGKKTDFHGIKIGKVEKKKKKTFKKLDNGAKQKKQIATKLKLAASRAGASGVNII